MKHLSLLGFCVLFYSSIFSQQTWTIDNGHSNINFEVGWEDFSIRTGEFKIFEGKISTNSWDDLTNATFDLKIDPASIDVIADNLSEQLRGERFLDATKFPEITYHSTETEAISDSVYISKGKLKIHGVEKDQKVLVKVKGFKETSRSYLLGIEVNLTINRTDYDLTWGSPRLGEMVKITGYLLYQMRIERQ